LSYPAEVSVRLQASRFNPSSAVQRVRQTGMRRRTPDQEEESEMFQMPRRLVSMEEPVIREH
jgi:hypothetical protein